MALKPIIEMPDDLIQDNASIFQFQLVRTSSVFEDPFSANIKTSDYFDERWYVSIDLPQRLPEGLEKADGWFDWDTFVDATNGRSGRFTMYNYLKRRPLGKATGIGDQRTTVTWDEDSTFWSDNANVFSPGEIYGFVNGGFHRGATSISIKGMVPNEEVSLKRGDNFSILHGPEDIPMLYKVMRTASSDANGICNVSIRPRLRYGTNHNTIVNFDKPRGVFKFAQDPEIIVSQGLRGRSSFQAFEVPEVLDEPRALSQLGGFR